MVSPPATQSPWGRRPQADRSRRASALSGCHRDAILGVGPDPALERDLWPVPPREAAQWLGLRDALEQGGQGPCQTTDAEAWWPDARDAHGPAARMALDACRQCEAAGPCLAYALAADQRYGIWGGTLPQDRQAIRWEAEAAAGGFQLGAG